jgi:hypothetical protein
VLGGDASKIVDEYSAKKLVRTKTSVPFSVSLARSDRREHLSTTELSDLRPYTISYPQLKTQWEKLPEELGYLGTYIPLIKHGPKGAADYMK